jgi:hypothetical protein
VNERPRVLEELGDELNRIADLVFLGSHANAAQRASAPRRRLSVLAVCLTLLILAAAATAAVLLIQQGSPLPAPHAQDLRSSGIPLPGSAHLAGLDAPDPNQANPSWDLRLSRTHSGETCTAVGQVLGGRFGIVGLDHVFRELPLGSVDSCGIDTADGPILVGAHEFVGSSSKQERTVLSGVAGRGARSVTAYATGAPRQLKLGAQGSFITVYAGAAEELRPRVVVVNRDGRAHTVTLEQSGAFEVADPHGGSGWAASAEADLTAGASPDEDCVQVTREPSQSESSHFSLPLTPEICGHLNASPLFVQMRRFVPGSTAGPFPWNNAPARTIVYGIATPRVMSLILHGAGAARTVPINRHGGAFEAVLDGHVDPRSLSLTATLRGGGQSTFSRPSQLLSSQTNQPIAAESVPPYRDPTPARAKGEEYPPFELQISSTVRETLRAEDPVPGKPTWVLRSWHGSPNPRVHGVGKEEFTCEELGVMVNGELVEPGHGSSSKSHPLGVEQGRCNQASAFKRSPYMLELEAFLDNPYEYTPHPARTVISGLLPPGAEDPTLLGTGPARPLPVDANNAFLIVLPGRYWNSSPRITYLLHGRRVGQLRKGQRPKLFPLGSFPHEPQVRAPDPDGGAPWGFAATTNCSTEVGRIVDGRFASIDLRDGVLKSGPEETGSGSSCAIHPEPFTPARVRRQPVEFNEQQIQASVAPFGGEPEPFSRPEIEQRSLPGHTIITGIAHADVTSVTLSTPSDVRTLRPSGPLHTILAVYDGFFLRGKLTATVRLRDRHVEDEQIDGLGAGSYQPPPPGLQLSEARRMLAQSRSQLANSKLSPGARRRALELSEQHLALIERHVRFEQSHPGLLPAQ